MLSYAELKKMIYIAETLLGVLLLIVAWKCGQIVTGEELSYGITKMITFAVGLVLLIFGSVSYLLRDDPDLWR